MSKTNSNNSAYLDIIVHEEKVEDVKVDFSSSHMCRVSIEMRKS
jgi:hypothetical protein